MDSFYNILLHAHSGLRWLVLIALLVAIFQTFSKRGKFGDISETKYVLITFILTNLQFIVGLILYFISEKVQFNSNTMQNDIIRFFTVEHILMMVVAVALINIGYSRSKRATKPFNSAFNFYFIALILILISIPWPFRELGSGWF